MKKAFGLIAATLVSTSVYSQSYESSSNPAQSTDPSAQKEQTPDYSSRQSESGAPASGESSNSTSSSGYEKSPGVSGGNSSTGQSSGANVSEDKTLTTRDSDVSGTDYRGAAQSEPEKSFQSGLSTESSASIEADGDAHVPASPIREGKKSEGWSTSGTFSGAGPGAVTGSASTSTSPDATPGVSSKSNNFNAEVSGNAGLSNRDEDLRARGLEPDSNQLTQQNSVEGDVDHDRAVIFEDWTISEPSSAIGGAADAEVGSASSSDVSVSIDSSASDSGYAQQLHDRVQRDWSSRSGSDMPATPLFDRSLDELSRTQYSTEGSVGAPAASVSGSSGKSESDAECETHKGAAAGYEHGTAKGDSDFDGSVRSSGTAIDHDERLRREYHFNRGDDEKAHINRSGSDSSASSSSSSAPSDYGDRSYDDGHISGNNSASGNSGSVESSGSASDADDTSVKQPDL